MGNSKSLLSKEELEDYAEFTYLTRIEILEILKKFSELGPTELRNDIHHRFHVRFVLELFPQLKYNPLRDRIFHVFSSKKDEHFSFEDFLDLASAMSDNCPLDCKSGWAFRLFDFDEDEMITRADLFQLIDRLMKDRFLDSTAKDKICDVVLQEIDFQNTGSMTDVDFHHAMKKIPNFAHTFRFRV